MLLVVVHNYIHFVLAASTLMCHYIIIIDSAINLLILYFVQLLFFLIFQAFLEALLCKEYHVHSFELTHYFLFYRLQMLVIL